MTDIAQCLLSRYGARGDLDTESFILETAEPLQPVIGTLSPGQHGSGASTINGQDAYTGQLVPVNVWAGSAQQDGVAAPLLNPAGGGQRNTDIDGATWVIVDQSMPSPDSLEPAEQTTTKPKRAG